MGSAAPSLSTETFPGRKKFLLPAAQFHSLEAGNDTGAEEKVAYAGSPGYSIYTLLDEKEKKLKKLRHRSKEASCN